GPRPSHLQGDRPSARRVRGAAVLCAARRRACRDPLRRRGRDRGCRPDRPRRHDRCGAQEPEAARRARLRRRQARARGEVRRGPHPQPLAGRRPAGDPSPHRRLRRRRVHRVHRPPQRRPAGPEPAAQARPLRRVLRVQGERLGRLVDHLRRQGARRARRPPRAAHLARRDQDHREGDPPPRGHLHPPVRPRGLPEGARRRRGLRRLLGQGLDRPRPLTCPDGGRRAVGPCVDPGGAQETFLDRLGFPHVLRWGFRGVLVFMTGNGVESNFVTPHIADAFGGGDDMINLAATIISMYSLAVLVGSYLAGALSDLWGPRRVMALGFAVWVVFEIAFLLALETDSAFLVGAAYFFRGFGFPLFAFAFLVWINAVVDKRRNGAAVGWFYVMFTGGLPTLGSLVAVFMIPSFGGGFSGQKWTMIASTVIVAIGFCIAWFGVKERLGSIRLAPKARSAGAVISSGRRLSFTNRRIAMGFLPRLITPRPE